MNRLWNYISFINTALTRMGKSLKLDRVEWIVSLKRAVDRYIEERPCQTYMGGHRLYMPKYIYGGYVNRFENDEAYTIELFSRLVRPGHIVLDVGANIGYYSLLAARLVGEIGIVYAIEPDPRNCRFLMKNIYANGYKNIKVLPIAISDKSGTKPLFLDRDSTETSLIRQKRREQAIIGEIVIETMSIDELCERERIQHVEVIKIDIEGGEPAAIRGAIETIRTNDITLFVEFCPLALKDSQTNPEEFIELLRDVGLKVFLIDEKQRRLLPEPLAYVQGDKVLGELKGNLLCHK